MILQSISDNLFIQAVSHKLFVFASGNLSLINGLVSVGKGGVGQLGP